MKYIFYNGDWVYIVIICSFTFAILLSYYILYNPRNTKLKLNLEQGNKKIVRIFVVTYITSIIVSSYMKLNKMYSGVQIDNMQIYLLHLWPRPKSNLNIEDIDYVKSKKSHRNDIFKKKVLIILLKDGRKHFSWGISKKYWNNLDNLLKEFKKIGIEINRRIPIPSPKCG